MGAHVTSRLGCLLRRDRGPINKRCFTFNYNSLQSAMGRWRYLWSSLIFYRCKKIKRTAQPGRVVGQNEVENMFRAGLDRADASDRKPIAAAAAAANWRTSAAQCHGFQRGRVRPGSPARPRSWVTGSGRAPGPGPPAQA
jgi:hypothetical protein